MISRFKFAVSYSSLSNLALIYPAIQVLNLPLLIKASPRNTRRRGLRCIKWAWTTAALVGIVAVSTVNAQQSAPAGAEPGNQIVSSNNVREGTSVQKPFVDPVYGTSSARGARYLLRNGLDYLSYGEYRRALKFLRETESRKNELNDTEKLVLQKNIENAQRGLREAADMDTPYALSDRAANRNGFSSAKPDTSTARQHNWPSVPAQRKPMLNEANEPRSTVKNSDDQGEPIRLARGDDDSIAASSHNPVVPKLSRTKNDVDTDRPRQFPEILALPKNSQELRKPGTDPSSTTELASAPIVDRAQNANLIQTSVDPERQLPPADRALVSDDATELLHTETEDISSLQVRQQRTSDSSAPPSSSIPTLVVIEEADHRPPSETAQDIRVNIANQANQAVASSTTTTASTTEAPDGIDELPPLPSNLGESTATPKSADKLVLTPTVTTDSHATSWADHGDLPSLSRELGHAVARPVDESTSSPATSAIQHLTTTSRNPSRNPSIATPNAAVDLSPPSISQEEAEPFPPPPAQNKDISVTVPRSAEALPSLAQSITEARSTSVQPGSSLESAESIGLRLNPASDGPNLASAEGGVLHRSLNNDAVDAPSQFPPETHTSNFLPSRIESIAPNRPSPSSTLRPELKREVETIARKQEDELRRRQQAQPPAPPHDTIISDLRAQTQLDISRAPSPAEARPIKAIPVPEDWVSLAPRNWSAQRKYWAAAATCHLPLYFQDPVLERYGHSIEQFVGPIGRYLTYPLDAPTQSTQRNQLLQPFFSAGLFAFQIAALPYNAIVDPPWEAQYDLGYYRPGDVSLTDMYWLPLHGYGPPLRGSNY
jgi:hypothetical protein